jgi:hypothetical protein
MSLCGIFGVDVCLANLISLCRQTVAVHRPPSQRQGVPPLVSNMDSLATTRAPVTSSIAERRKFGVVAEMKTMH